MGRPRSRPVNRMGAAVDFTSASTQDPTCGGSRVHGPGRRLLSHDTPSCAPWASAVSAHASETSFVQSVVPTRSSASSGRQGRKHTTPEGARKRIDPDILRWLRAESGNWSGDHRCRSRHLPPPSSEASCTSSPARPMDAACQPTCGCGTERSVIRKKAVCSYEIPLDKYDG